MPGGASGAGRSAAAPVSKAAPPSTAALRISRRRGWGRSVIWPLPCVVRRLAAGERRRLARIARSTEFDCQEEGFRPATPRSGAGRIELRVALIGQQAFGKATLDAFLARGDTVAAVFCAPEKGRPDPLRVAAEAAGVPVQQLPSLTGSDAVEAMRAARADLGVMAFVTQFVSQEFCAVPKFGTIQFHPSLLPLHRGA